jgi:hypothetical protein
MQAIGGRSEMTKKSDISHTFAGNSSFRSMDQVSTTLTGYRWEAILFLERTIESRVPEFCLKRPRPFLGLICGRPSTLKEKDSAVLLPASLIE